jgi:hypothetical protein
VEPSIAPRRVINKVVSPERSAGFRLSRQSEASHARRTSASEVGGVRTDVEWMGQGLLQPFDPQ